MAIHIRRRECYAWLRGGRLAARGERAAAEDRTNRLFGVGGYQLEAIHAG